MPTPEPDPSPPSVRLHDHFASLADPRRRKVMHPLINVVAIAVCAVVAGADDFVSIALWGRERRDWLSKFLDLSAGVPLHDRFNAIFRALDTRAFEACLLGWIAALHEATAGRVVAIDGKTLRGSFDRASGKSAIYMVSAWATDARLSLGQVVVDAKSNEITAIPELLELEGCLVTIDAMGCQVEIAGAIRDRKADYVLAVKDNQPTLHRGVEGHFLGHMEDDFATVAVTRHETKEKGHGRADHRAYYVCDAPADLPDRERWPGLAAIGVAINVSTRDGKPSDAVRYYILSRRLDARAFAEAVRGHWGIEIPRPEDPRSDSLCAVGRADYHRRRRPVGVGRVERHPLSGPRRHLMLDSESNCVPPRPRHLRRTH
ncbi:ISAs1 family transposase [Paludisphaera mucosa]|uniref:ISAs1 family transposase n=1 Tax=Paludisphaera mucosa TaxID=3030827 RepID=A0ABT6FLC4_9BACT|nr:ISAs1 family transposase [Paludisphaera mucosa]MDG3008378.1 ISAs1 family transposase [Paludisphaera mucosa]